MGIEISFALPEVIDIFQVEDLHERFSRLLSDDATSIHLDASNVRGVDGSGLQLLLVFTLGAADRGKQVVFVDPSDELSTVIDRTGTEGLMTLEKTARGSQP